MALNPAGKITLIRTSLSNDRLKGKPQNNQIIYNVSITFTTETTCLYSQVADYYCKNVCYMFFYYVNKTALQSTLNITTICHIKSQMNIPAKSDTIYLNYFWHRMTTTIMTITLMTMTMTMKMMMVMTTTMTKMMTIMMTTMTIVMIGEFMACLNCVPRFEWWVHMAMVKQSLQWSVWPKPAHCICFPFTT